MHIGDTEFINSLPAELADLGEAFLLAVRANWQGGLSYHPSAKMFVETPRNFFTVTVRPRKGLLAVTTYGRPEKYTNIGSRLALGLCRSNYTWFEVRTLEDIPEAMRLLEHANAMATRNHRRRKGDPWSLAG